jgi:hypothetical protein
MSSSTIFSSLISSFPTWPALKAHLVSAEGGALSVTEQDHLALIRYVKGTSNMDLPHVRACRSVVWNTATHRPVSVTAFKSESVGDTDSMQMTPVIIEEFVDGVMIGQFWDAVTESWRIHTRSTLDARCRYYSKRSFAELFAEAAATVGLNTDSLDRAVSYTWILQHPENRVVCPVQRPRIVLVQQVRIAADTLVASTEANPAGEQVAGVVEYVSSIPTALESFRPKRYYDSAATDSSYAHAAAGANHIMLMLLASMRNGIQHQGLVFRSPAEPFRRWKTRSQMYDTVRHLRGNTARLDYMWMDMWSRGTLEDYLKWYPEERRPAMDIIQKWKAVTQEAYNLYVAIFKARSTERTAVPAKLKPLVYGLHTHYTTALKPAKRSLDWRECVSWCNDRDTALKIFVLNWDQRAANTAANTFIPVEPAPTSTGRHVADSDTAAAAAEN